jgi:hypothetical protein
MMCFAMLNPSQQSSTAAGATVRTRKTVGRRRGQIPIGWEGAHTGQLEGVVAPSAPALLSMLALGYEKAMSYK